MGPNLLQALYDSLNAGKSGVKAAFAPKLGGPDAESAFKSALAGGIGAAMVPVGALDEAATGAGQYMAEDIGRAGAAVERAGMPTLGKALGVGGAALGMIPVAASFAVDPEAGAIRAIENEAIRKATKEILAANELSRLGWGDASISSSIGETLAKNSKNISKVGNFEKVFSDMPGFKEAIERNPYFGKQEVIAISDPRYTRPASYWGGDAIVINPDIISNKEIPDLRGATLEGITGHEFQHALRRNTGRGADAQFWGIENPTAGQSHALSPAEARADKYGNYVSGGGLPRFDKKVEDIRREVRLIRKGQTSLESLGENAGQQKSSVQNILDRARAILPASEYSREVVPTIKKSFGAKISGLRYAIPLAGLGAAASLEGQ